MRCTRRNGSWLVSVNTTTAEIMNLYLISQTENSDYDTYDSAVVCAPNEDEARNTNPSDGNKFDWAASDRIWHWCSSPGAVTVKLLGRANETVEAGLVCASYHAG